MAEITGVSPPTVYVRGCLATLDGDEVATCTAKCAMLDRLVTSMPKTAPQQIVLDGPDRSDGFAMGLAECACHSFRLRGGECGADSVASAVCELRRAQAELVRLLQAEYFCDDVQLPDGALGWSETELRGYFERGGGTRRYGGGRHEQTFGMI